MMQSVNVSLCGSSFDTFLSVVDAAGNIIAFNDDKESCGTSSELTFNTNGLGLCYIIVEGWGNETGDYILNVDANYLGQTQLDNEHIVVSPNPASDRIFIYRNVDSEAMLSIYDSNGKLHIRKSLVNKIEEIDVNGLSSGMYLYLINEGRKDQVVTGKFVITKN